MRENAQAKARRYLVEGRLIITHVNGDCARATCRGDGEIYELGSDGPQDYCTCPARTRCSHLYALGAVTAPRRSNQR